MMANDCIRRASMTTKNMIFAVAAVWLWKIEFIAFSLALHHLSFIFIGYYVPFVALLYVIRFREIDLLGSDR